MKVASNLHVKYIHDRTDFEVRRSGVFAQKDRETRQTLIVLFSR